jgi:hypothetical protein
MLTFDTSEPMVWAFAYPSIFYLGNKISAISTLGKNFIVRIIDSLDLAAFFVDDLQAS